MNTIKSIAFDLDGTLLDHSGAEGIALEKTLKEFDELSAFYSHNTFAVSWRSSSEKFMNQYLQGYLSFPEQQTMRIQEVWSAAGIKLSDIEARNRFEIYLKNYENSWIPYSDVIESLDKLSKLRLGVISNGDDTQQKRKLEKIGIDSNFTTIITAGGFGKSKPSKEIFLEYCSQENVSPDEVIYVGDNFNHDAVASTNAGCFGIWLNRMSTNETNEKNIVEINSLFEISNYLKL